MRITGRKAGYLPLMLCLALSWPALPLVAQAPREIDWIALLPDADFQALSNPPPILHDSLEEDDPVQPLLRWNGQDANDAFSRAMVSTGVRTELDGTLVSLPGFVVPLEYDAQQRVVEFFLVPFFGACIHFPPPPPNQIVHVIFPAGFDLISLQQPMQVSGRMSTEITDHEIGMAAYRISADAIAVFEDAE